MTRDAAVAIVGCGRMGRERAKHLVAAGVTIRYFIDEDPSRAVALGSEWRQGEVASSIEAIDWRRIDAVFLCTPPAYRRPVLNECASHRCAVFIEKPLAVNAAEAEALVSLAEMSALTTGVGYMNRYRRGVLRAREAARDGALIALSCHWAGKPYAVPWWSQPHLSGGPVNEQATHLVDLCRYIGGEITAIGARQSAGGDGAAAWLAFRSGAIGTLLYSCALAEKAIGMTVMTRGGTIYLDGWDLEDRSDASGQRDSSEDPFALEVAAFVKAIRTGDRSSIRCDVREALKTQHVVDALRGVGQFAMSDGR